MKFQIDTNSAGQFIWRVLAGNFKVIATAGESYVRKENCVHGINLVKGTTSASQYEVYLDQSRLWRWRLVATNGQIIAVSSESYVSRTDAEHGVSLVISTSASTPVEDLTAAVRC